MSKYTQGPYKACLGSGRNVCTGIKSEKTNQMIADVCPDYFLKYSNEVSPEEQNANLGLLCAAPELVESLKAMVELVTKLLEDRVTTAASACGLRVSDWKAVFPSEWHVANKLLEKLGES